MRVRVWRTEEENMDYKDKKSGTRRKRKWDQEEMEEEKQYKTNTVRRGEKEKEEKQSTFINNCQF